MKIKEIHIDEYGPYKDWSFSPNQKGLTVLYGPNESGKTSLLQAIRWGLFGKKGRAHEKGKVRFNLHRMGEDYTLEREGKYIQVINANGNVLEGEPSLLWWHGLDRKAYDRIFGITLEDMQGVDILKEVEVRTRFFGAEGGDRISQVVRELHIQRGDLLVASVNGKKKINLLIEELKDVDREIHRLSQEENRYVDLQRQLDSTVVTEQELLERKGEWKEYSSSIELVLRAWDTYKRSETAKLNMTKFSDSEHIDGDAFSKLDKEIEQCQEYMRIWRGREEGLVPDNFDPSAEIGAYSKDIESLYEELSKWVQLQKEIPEGELYLQKVRDQLSLARRIHSTWRNVDELPKEVNWFDGERLSRLLRSANERVEEWKSREPKRPEEFEEQLDKRNEKDSLSERESAVLKMKQLFYKRSDLERALEVGGVNPKLWSVGAGSSVIVGLLLFGAGILDEIMRWYVLGGLVVLALCMYAYPFVANRNVTKEKEEIKEDLRRIDKKMKVLDDEYQIGVPYSLHDVEQMEKDLESLRKQFYSYDVELAKLYSYEKEMELWREEGKQLEKEALSARKEWESWLPREASQILQESDFFSLKEEYERYMERLHEYEGYEKRLNLHKEELRRIEDKGAALWEKLNLTVPITPLELRSVYTRLQHHKQNHVRWEQKESQRKNYHEEYMGWSKKEKELLLEREELVQKAGLKSVGEYRQRLLRQEQYRQWETIYKQSQIQLDLLAPKGEHHDLLYRRLQGNDKLKWEAEYSRSESELKGIEEKLSKLYEQRGQLQETMRNMANAKTMTLALQEKEQLEESLREALLEWTTSVFTEEFMERAQKNYEKDKRPQTLERASLYISHMTGGTYVLDISSVEHRIALLTASGERVPMEEWSSGLGDQVYLALRLSLAVTYSKTLEGLPIILDDILVRFDEGRQKAALELLEEIGRDEQIILCTCHEFTYQLGRSIPGVSGMMLSR